MDKIEGIDLNEVVTGVEDEREAHRLDVLRKDVKRYVNGVFSELENAEKQVQQLEISLREAKEKRAEIQARIQKLKDGNWDDVDFQKHGYTLASCSFDFSVDNNTIANGLFKARIRNNDASLV